MKFDRSRFLLYAVTDRTWLKERTLSSAVETACDSGATLIQLREKELSFDEFLSEALEIKKITDKYGVPLIINDNVEVALRTDAAGVHVGQNDADAESVRARICGGRMLGVSVQTAEQAQRAQKAGADYLGVGAVFATSTKLDAGLVPLERLREICSSVSIPVVAIGGIGECNVKELAGSGIAGISVVSAIFGSADIAGATRRLKILAGGVV